MASSTATIWSLVNPAACRSSMSIIWQDFQAIASELRGCYGMWMRRIPLHYAFARRRTSHEGLSPKTVSSHHTNRLTRRGIVSPGFFFVKKSS